MFASVTAKWRCAATSCERESVPKDVMLFHEDVARLVLRTELDELFASHGQATIRDVLLSLPPFAASETARRAVDEADVLRGVGQTEAD
jgi:hypothetical protein